MSKELKLENKWVYLSFAVGALYYLAYYFKFPNSYSAVVSFILLTLLIKNFKKIEGLKVIIYSLFISIVTLAISMMGSSSIVAGLIILALNLIILLLMIVGLKGFRIWGLYLSIVMFLIGLISVFNAVIGYDVQYFSWTAQNIIFNLKIFAAMSFSITSIAFLIKHRKAFGSK